MTDVPTLDDLLLEIFDQAIIVDTMEDGLDMLADRLDTDASHAVLAGVVQDAVAAGLLHDPVRLPPGALHCHWHLELTPRGQQAVLDLRR
jgi:hypothetical protein